VSFVVEKDPVIIYANLRLNSALPYTSSTGNLRGVRDYDPFERVSNNLVRGIGVGIGVMLRFEIILLLWDRGHAEI